MKLFVCGSRTITDKEWIYSKIEECIADNQFTDITLFNDNLQGVDSIAREWAESHNICIKNFPLPVPESPHSLFYKRDDRMVQECDFMLNVWDGISSESFNDIITAEKNQKPYKLCLYTENQAYADAVNSTLQKHKKLLFSPLNARAIKNKFQSIVNQTLAKQIIEKTSSGTNIEPWWEEGHNPGSYFWVFPVRQTQDKTPDNWGGCKCYIEDQISIEEGVVEDYLYNQFLKPYFDNTIEYSCRVRTYDKEEISFDWYDYNLYTYETIRKMAAEMKLYSNQNSLTKKESDFYSSLADRLLLMMERNPDWDYITFEGP